MKFRSGDKVKWMQPNQFVDHPEGKTDRKGNMLKVMRDKELTGIVQGKNIKGYTIMIDNRGYTVSVVEEKIQLIKGE
jgi:hypothetical protein